MRVGGSFLVELVIVTEQVYLFIGKHMDIDAMKAESDIRILYVEDNPGDIELVRIAMRVLNFNATLVTAGDGLEAFELLSAHFDLPDLILLDLNLPKMTGMELLQAIRRDPQLEHIPVIILTGSSSKEEHRRLLDAKHGNVTILTKPCEFPRLIELVKHIRSQVALPS
jgi:two-component system, chemotaxis family, response regulator Rcp1